MARGIEPLTGRGPQLTCDHRRSDLLLAGSRDMTPRNSCLRWDLNPRWATCCHRHPTPAFPLTGVSAGPVWPLRHANCQGDVTLAQPMFGGMGTSYSWRDSNPQPSGSEPDASGQVVLQEQALGTLLRLRESFIRVSRHASPPEVGLPCQPVRVRSVTSRGQERTRTSLRGPSPFSPPWLTRIERDTGTTGTSGIEPDYATNLPLREACSCLNITSLVREMSGSVTCAPWTCRGSNPMSREHSGLTPTRSMVERVHSVTSRPST